MRLSSNLRFGLLTLALVCGAVRLLGASLDVKTTLGGVLKTKPGEVVTLGWTLSNDSEAGCVVRETYELPAGWQLIAMESAGQAAFTVAARDNTVRLSAVVVPSSARAGEYAIVCGWMDADHPERSLARERIVVHVEKSDRVELLARETPWMVVAGENYTATFLAINRGNSSLELKAAARVSTGYSATITPTDFLLEPGAMKTVEISVKTPADLTQSVPLSLQATVTSSSGVSSEITVTADIFASASNDRARREWPALLQTRWSKSAANGNGRFQALLEGSARSEDGAQLYYLLRSAGGRNERFFNEREHYGAEYTGRRVSWQAGHGDYALSPLTSRPHYGAGGAFSIKTDEQVSAGGFVMRSRESASVESEAGAFARYRVSPGVTLGLNALAKQEGSRQRFAGERSGTLSMEAQFNAGPALEGKVEVGVSPLRPDGASGSPLAHRVEVNGNPGRTNYSVTWERYGAGYFGTLNNASLLIASLRQALTQELELRAEESVRSYTNPYSLPEISLVSNRETSHVIGVSWRAWKNLQLTGEALRSDRSFGFVDSPTRYIESTGRFGARYSYKSVAVSSSVEVGSLEGRQGDLRRAPVRRSTASIDWSSPSSRENVSVFVSAGNDPYSSVSAKTRTVGASLHAKVGANLTATAQVGQNFYDAREARRRSYVTGELTHTLKDKQTIGLRSTWSDKTAADSAGVAWALTYSRPLNLPLPSLSRRSSIEGTLTDANTGEPLRRVVLTLNGRTTVTDRRGHYTFSELGAGSYTLNVDARSLGPDRLIREKLPLAIRVGRGDVQQIALSAETAGRVYVQIENDKDLPPESTAQSRAGMVVHLVNGDESAVLSEITDESGRAVFRSVRPGEWKLKADSDRLPARYRLSQPEEPVLVAASDQREVKLTLRYDAPAIRWVSSN